MKDWITLTSPAMEADGVFYIRASAITMVSAPTDEMLFQFPKAKSQVSLALLTCAVGASETPEEVMEKLLPIEYPNSRGPG